MYSVNDLFTEKTKCLIREQAIIIKLIIVTNYYSNNDSLFNAALHYLKSWLLPIILESNIMQNKFDAKSFIHFLKKVIPWFPLINYKTYNISLWPKATPCRHARRGQWGQKHHNGPLWQRVPLWSTTIYIYTYISIYYWIMY